jgi:hypothetical protein
MRKPRQRIPVDQLRSAHYMRRSRGVGFPRLSVALSVVCSSVEVEGLQRERDTRLLAWSAAAWGDGGDGAPRTQNGTGTDALSFWRWLSDVRRGVSTTWLWQLGAGYGCTILGLWDLLEKGLWSLDGYDPLDGTPVGKGASSALRGLCVLQEPPFVLLAAESHAKGIVKWVDVRNLGVDQWREIYADVFSDESADSGLMEDTTDSQLIALQRAAFLANWLRDWYSTVEELQLGGLRHTAAAQAWHGWRHSYLEGPIFVHTDRTAIAIERDAVYPGRNECFRLGRIGTPVYHLDASAFYPGIAAQVELPGRLRGCETGDLRRAQSLARMGWCVIGSGYVDTSEPLVPVRIGDATIYPVGRFGASLCWPEWELLIQRGATVEITGLSYYEPATVCRRFSERLWSYRIDCEHKGARARARCVKRIANSLIGKFAAWDWGWVDAPGVGSGYPYSAWYQIDPETGQLERWRSIGWHVQKEQCNGEAQDSCPAIAAWVYSVGRVRMAEWIRLAGRRHCYYCDTDSLYVDQTAYDRLVASGAVQDRQPGCLSLRKIHPWCEIWGLKSYATPDGIVCSGISEGAHLVTDGGFEFWHPETVAGCLRDKRAPRNVMLRYRVPERSVYRHGIVQSDGTVTPHRLPAEDTSDGTA